MVTDLASDGNGVPPFIKSKLPCLKYIRINSISKMMPNPEIKARKRTKNNNS